MVFQRIVDVAARIDAGEGRGLLTRLQLPAGLPLQWPVDGLPVTPPDGGLRVAWKPPGLASWDLGYWGADVDGGTLYFDPGLASVPPINDAADLVRQAVRRVGHVTYLELAARRGEAWAQHLPARDAGQWRRRAAHARDIATPIAGVVDQLGDQWQPLLFGADTRPAVKAGTTGKW